MKRLIIILLSLAVVGGFVGYKMYNKPHQNIETASADLAIKANDIFSDFENDEAAAGAKYNDKIVAVSGKISAIEKEEDGIVKVTLDAGGDFGGVICQMEPETDISKFKEGANVTLKGKCTGYLMDVILVRCVPDN